jgi:hypothetical protein
LQETVQAIAGRLHLQGVQLHKHVTAHTALQQAGRQRQHVSSSSHCLPLCYIRFLKFAVLLLLLLTLLNECHCLCVWWWWWFCRSCPSRPQADHQEGHVCRGGPLHSRRDKAPPAYKPSPAIAGFHSQGGEEHQRPSPLAQQPALPGSLFGTRQQPVIYYSMTGGSCLIICAECVLARCHACCCCCIHRWV